MLRQVPLEFVQSSCSLRARGYSVDGAVSCMSGDVTHIQRQSKSDSFYRIYVNMQKQTDVLHQFHSLSESGNIMKNVVFVISCFILLFSPRFPLPVFVCFTALLLNTPASHQLIPPGVLKRVFSPHFLQSVHLFARLSLPGLLLLTFVCLNFLGLDLRFLAFCS